MTDEASETVSDASDNEKLHGAVIAGIIPDQPPRVLKEAARYAKLFQAPLVVVHVDVTRFVTYEDPDGYVHSAPIDMNIASGETELALERRVVHVIRVVLQLTGDLGVLRLLTATPHARPPHI